MTDPPGGAGGIGRWWLLLPLAVIALPAGLAFHDWAQAVRTAYNSAASLAWSRAAGHFLGREWAEVPPAGVTMTVTEMPPRAGVFAGYAYAAHVETSYEWQPIFHPIVGGPYRVSGRATAAILRDETGKWMPLVVE